MANTEDRTAYATALLSEENLNVPAETNWELIFGCLLAVIAAILALNDIGSGRFGDDEMQLINEKASAYQWYQSKSIKETLAESQMALLQTLMQAGAISESTQAAMLKQSEETRQDIMRYKKEKKEILLGSNTVGKENWAQDIDGEMGKVVGAKEMEKKLELLGQVGDRFDLANLFLQISIVLGAVGMIMKKVALKKTFLNFTIITSILGIFLSIVAFRMGMGS